MCNYLQSATVMAPLDGEPNAVDPLITLTEASEAFRHSNTPTDSLKPPTFDWAQQTSMKNSDSSRNLWRVGKSFKECPMNLVMMAPDSSTY